MTIFTVCFSHVSNNFILFSIVNSLLNLDERSKRQTNKRKNIGYFQGNFTKRLGWWYDEKVELFIVMNLCCGETILRPVLFLILSLSKICIFVGFCLLLDYVRCAWCVFFQLAFHCGFQSALGDYRVVTASSPVAHSKL